MNERKRENNKFWIIILCALFVVMVGLIVGIVAVSVGKNSGTTGDNGSQEEDGIQSGEGVVEPLIIGGDNGEGESEDGEGNEGDGVGEDTGSPNETEEEQEQVQEQVAVENSVKDYIRQMSVEEALEFLDTRIEIASGADEMFSMRLIKINVLNNASRHEDALAEAEKINNVEELSKWNKCEYYNMMAYTYQVLGDAEKENEYGEKYIQAYKDIWGDFAGSE